VSQESIGIIGLGIVGSRVAENYRAAGYHVSVWSRTPRSDELNFLATPAEVASASQVVQIFVNTGESLLSVLENMRPALTDRHIIINSSTISLQATLAAEKLVTACGAQFLDCPFTGSKAAAAAGQLVYYVGGSGELLEKVRPLLRHSSKEILLLGGIGEATVLKLVTNMISATTVQILAEAMAVTAAAGIPQEKFLRAMEGNANCSGLARMKIPAMAAGDFSPHFSLKNMLKDSRFALELATAHNLDLPALKATSQCMAELDAQGRGEEDFAVLAAKYFPV
jgi:3-hydroxyisobutyrate dehydrogenase-like beta-hydroxyacid dehydrogenase